MIPMVVWLSDSGILAKAGWQGFNTALARRAGRALAGLLLLVDKSDKPIIVDQPEENLDNQTVYHLLILIRAVKKRR